jgi:pimeloyl-ACP methyl ester carboxylesterase
MLAARTPIAESSARHILERGTTAPGEGEESERVCFAHDPALHGSSRLQLTEEQVTAFLEAIECPSLLVRPEEGWPVDEALVRRRTEAIEDLQIERVPGGHHAHLDEPRPIGEAIDAFLTELDDRGGPGR